MASRARMTSLVASIAVGACATQERPAIEATPGTSSVASSAPTTSALPSAPHREESEADVAAPKAFTPAPTVSCPPTFAQAYVVTSGVVQPACHLGDAPCSYPEGTCQCGGFPSCGGAAPPRYVPKAPGKLSCTASDPNWMRPDGCTDAPPKEGGPCAKEGKLCSYGDCEWRALKATCKGGSWRLTQYRGPGPP